MLIDPTSLTPAEGKHSTPPANNVTTNKKGSKSPSSTGEKDTTRPASNDDKESTSPGSTHGDEFLYYLSRTTGKNEVVAVHVSYLLDIFLKVFEICDFEIVFRFPLPPPFFFLFHFNALK